MEWVRLGFIRFYVNFLVIITDIQLYVPMSYYYVTICIILILVDFYG